MAANCVSILVCSKNDGNSAVETASNEMLMGAVRVFCEFSLLVRQQNQSALSLKDQADALQRFYQKKGIVREQKMSQSAKAKVDDLLATESH